MNDRVFVKALGVCVLLVAASHGALAMLKQQVGFFDVFNHMLTSAPMLDDFFNAAARDARPKVLVLGDSVVFGSGLQAHGVKDWRRHSIPACLQDQLRAYAVVDASMDGSLPADYLAIYRKAQRLAPDWVVLNVNARMLAEAYQQGIGALSRVWLIDDLPGDRLGLTYAFTPTDRVLTGLRQGSLLFRYSEAMRSRIFFPSREECFNRWLQALLPAKSWQEPEDKELLLKLKLKPYYYAPRLNQQSASLRALAALLAEMRQQGQKVVVYFTPQNREFIEEIYHPENYAANVEQVHKLMRGYADGHTVHYLDWSGRFPAQAFFDHCHLTPEYNQALAGLLADIILAQEAERGRQSAAR